MMQFQIFTADSRYFNDAYVHALWITQILMGICHGFGMLVKSLSIYTNNIIVSEHRGEVITFSTVHIQISNSYSCKMIKKILNRNCYESFPLNIQIII